jgi:hypothetical protein
MTTKKSQLRDEGRHEHAKPASSAQQKAEGRGDNREADEDLAEAEGRHEGHTTPGNVEPDPPAVPES